MKNMVYNDQSRKILHITLVGFVLNLLLSVAKCAIGHWGNSHAVFADGIHSLSDTVTDVVVVVGMPFWNKPPDVKHPYGHRKIENLVTICIGLVLGWVALKMLAQSWDLVYVAKKSLSQDISPSIWALMAALVSIVTKEGLFRWTSLWGKKLHSMALSANAWHHRSDVFSSIPVVVAVTGAMVNPKLWFLDDLGALVVSLFILKAAYEICAKPLGQLLDEGVSKKELVTIYKSIQKVPGILGVHKVQTRYLGGDALAVTLHLEVDPRISVWEGNELAKRVKGVLMVYLPNMVDAVIYVEPYRGDMQRAPGKICGGNGADHG